MQVGGEIVAAMAALAAVAIDDTTFRRAGRERCAAFVRHVNLAIRGRAQPETVHALPLAG